MKQQAPLSVEERVSRYLEEVRRRLDPSELRTHIQRLIRANEEQLGTNDGKDDARMRTLAVLRAFAAQQEAVERRHCAPLNGDREFRLLR